MEELGIEVTLGSKLIVALKNTPSGWEAFHWLGGFSVVKCVLGGNIQPADIFYFPLQNVFMNSISVP